MDRKKNRGNCLAMSGGLRHSSHTTVTTPLKPWKLFRCLGEPSSPKQSSMRIYMGLGVGTHRNIEAVNFIK